MKEIYSPQEVAEMLDVHVKTVRRYLSNGTIIGNKIGGCWKISTEEIEKQINKRIPNEFSMINKKIVKGEGNIRRCLIIEIDVLSQTEANSYAQVLLSIISSNKYTECNFKYHFDKKVAKFIINGASEYLSKMLIAIEEIERNEDK